MNRNQQAVLRKSNEKGTDSNSLVWILQCQICNYVYGCNNTDAFERKCPNCQGGKPGLKIPTEHDGEDWTREEHIIAFNLYSQIPFGTIHERNPKIIALAALLGRKVGSASRKLANLSRFDPVLLARGVRGLEHGAKGEREVWEEFSNHPENLAYESTRLLAQRLNQPIEEVAELDDSEMPPPGEEREALVRLRVRQSFFRKRVLSAYNFRCCVTGLDFQPLLVASHIVPWAEDPANRLNPRNGLCLNALHDRLFDRRLMWVEDNFTVRFSTKLRTMSGTSKQTLDWIMSYHGETLILPTAFKPDTALLKFHARKRIT